MIGRGRIYFDSGPIGDVSADLQARVQANVDNLSAQGKAALLQNTGVDITNARVQQGAASAVSLVQNGFTPGNPQDDALLVHSIAGGLCLVPAVGPILGAAVEALWAVGNVAACPTVKLFASLGFGDVGPECGGPPCRTSGTWTTAQVMAASRLPELVPGTFRAFVIPALAVYMAQALNCKASFPPSIVVDAAVAIWNATHAGPQVDIYVPPLPSGEIGLPLIPFWQNTTGCDPNGVCGQDSNVYYAFWPMLFTYWKVLAQAPSPPPAPMFMPFDPPRVVTINGGAILPAPVRHPTALHFGAGAHAPAPAAVASSGASPLVVAGTVAAVLASAGAAWYLAGGRAIARVFRKG